MGLSSMTASPKLSLRNPTVSATNSTTSSSMIFPVSQHLLPSSEPSNAVSAKLELNSYLQNSKTNLGSSRDSIGGVAYPTMNEILNSSRAQKLDLELRTIGPFFRITAKSLETQNELGRAEGIIRVWLGGKVLHLDSIRLRRETLGMEKSIFGIGLFIGAVAIRYGYDCGCRTAELLAINDTDLYHRKLVRFYTRIGFKAVYEVTGSTFGDLAHMLVWGGIGTRMDANVEELLIKWCTRFKPLK